MIRNLKDLKEYINSDLFSRKINFSFKIIFDPLIRFHILLRVYEYAENKSIIIPLRLLLKIWFRRLSLKLGFSIPINVVGKGFCIVHYGTIIITPNAKIGENCRLHAGVNIGGKAGFYSVKEAKNLAPIIGNDVYIGPGAKIFGDVTIASGIKIGANAVINKSCHIEGCSLVGIPARPVVSNE